MNWRQVSKTEFYNVMNPLDVHPHPQKSGGLWFDTWKLRHGRVVGRTERPGWQTTLYFLPA